MKNPLKRIVVLLGVFLFLLPVTFAVPGEAAAFLIQNFETGTAGFSAWMVDANATWGIHTETPLVGNGSLYLKTKNGAGCYVDFPAAVGQKDIGLRLKTFGTCAVIRIGANGQTAHYKRSENSIGYSELTTSDFVYLNVDGKPVQNVASYDTAWGGIRFSTEFDGYLILKNTNAVNIQTINIGIFHASTNSEGFMLLADQVFATNQTNYSEIIGHLQPPSPPAYTPGDFNRDSTTDALDVALLQKALLQNTPAQNVLRDVNGDGVCDVRDLIRLKKVITGDYDMGFSGDKFGLFVHYVPYRSVDAGGKTYDLNGTADRFDAVQFAKDVQSVGADYVIFTAWHEGWRPLYPSAVMERYCPGHSAKRDLIGDLLTEMEKVGIPVYLYTHPYLGYHLNATERTATGYGVGNDPNDSSLPNPATFNSEKWNGFICALYDELCTRYAGRLAGLFLDEGTSNAKMGDYCDFARLRQTVKAHGDLLMIQNFYGTNYGCDIGMKEYGPGWGEFNGSADKWPCYELPVGITMSADWMATRASGTSPVRYSVSDMYRYTVMQAGCNTDGGGVIWAAGNYVGSGWEDGVLETLQAVGASYRAAGCTLKDTMPSRAFPTVSGTSLSGLSAGFVATASQDGLVEYLHVLKAPSGKRLDLPEPADGKIFGKAALTDGTAISLQKNTSGYTVTLPNGVDWDPTDTVICLSLSGRNTPPNKTVYLRDTDPRMVYTGQWEYSRWERNCGDYENDVHQTVRAGDTVSFAFNGTGVTCLMPKSGSQGKFKVKVDAQAEKTYSANAAAYKAQQKLGSVTGLANGRHTVTVTCVSGTLMIDGFIVTCPTDETP